MHHRWFFTGYIVSLGIRWLWKRQTLAKFDLAEYHNARHVNLVIWIWTLHFIAIYATLHGKSKKICPVHRGISSTLSLAIILSA